MKRFTLILQLCFICLPVVSAEPLNEHVQDFEQKSPDHDHAPINKTSMEDHLPDSDTSKPPLADVSEAVSHPLENNPNHAFLEHIPEGWEMSDLIGGSYLFINNSKMKVAGEIGDSKFELNPGEKNLLQPMATHTGGGCQVTLSYLRGEKWKVFRNTRWTNNARYRSLVVFHENAANGRLMVSTIVDLLPYEPLNSN